MPDGYEKTDVSVRGVALSGVALAIFIFVILGVSALLFRAFHRSEESWRAHQATASSAAVTSPYAGPLLQVRPEDELAALRAENRRALDGYARLDESFVRIPIDDAMKILAQRGLPPAATLTFEEMQRQRIQP